MRATHTWTRRVSQKFTIQGDVHFVDIYADGDWAQDRHRKSVSCIVTVMGIHCLRRQYQHIYLEKRNSVLKSKELQSDGVR